MSRKKLAAIIVPCIIAIVVAIVMTTRSPEEAKEPEQVAVSAYNLSEQLFDPELTSLQRESFWDEYEGKQVKWIGELESLTPEEERIIARFPNPVEWGDTEIVAIFDKSQKSSLLELKEGNLIIYEGVLDGFGEAEISLTDCTFISLAIVPLWWNNDIDTQNKRILVGHEVLFLGPPVYAIATQCQYPDIIAIDRETGELLWEKGSRWRESVLVGIDSQYVYIWNVNIAGTANRDYVVESNIEALNKTSGQIAWTSLSYEKVMMGNDWAIDSQILPDVITEIIDKAESGLILSIDKPPLPSISVEHEGVIYISGCDVNSSGSVEQCDILGAIDKTTGSVLWAATFQSLYMRDFDIRDGILYVSTEKGVGAFSLLNVTEF